MEVLRPEQIVTSTPIKISEDPDDYHSHFIQLTPKTNKGQARYRCVTCGHEFSCSGKRRKLQHILGKEMLIGNCKNRNVVPCKKPYEPLKKNLIRLCANDKELLKTNSFVLPSPTRSSNHQNQNQTQSNNHSLISGDGHVDSEFHSMLEDILSWEQDKDHDDEFDGTVTSFSASSGSSDEGDEFPTPKKLKSHDGTASEPSMTPQNSFYVPPPQSGVNLRRPLSFTSRDSTSTTEALSLSDYNQMTNRQNLNRAILNFFFAYQIPLQAMESSSFQDMINQLQVGESFPESSLPQDIPMFR